MHNAAVSKVDHNVVHNTYVDRTVVQENKGPNHAFNGKGGITAKPSDSEVRQAAHRIKPRAGTSLACARGTSKITWQRMEPARVTGLTA